ncbi:hypothetical protein N7466_005887 [Penicillium verhagenii]|uniref:uncharacterized protein n=1 Tax=Penicillium verhagenii TaxID=1562060 RepID=UPI0025457C29|nr:uncharacterized protein N7466_005887 [Penicillium verhagenii]KAJ5930394.1 hypothetical protein N7466_005887 [Penicillium verhagenii]
MTLILRYKVPRTLLKGYSGNFFSPNAQYQRAYPQSYKGPGDRDYSDFEKLPYRHKDHFQRVYEGLPDERFLDPVTGKVRELIVQCADKVYNGPPNTTYKRTFIRDVSPLTLRLANWPMSGFDADEIDDDADGDKKRSKSNTLKHILSSTELLVKWPISCLLLYPVVGIPGLASTGQIVNQGGYDPFPYRYWGYCKVARNTLEDRVAKSFYGSSLTPAIATSLKTNRILEPPTLCFDIGEDRSQTLSVEEWKKNPKYKNPDKNTAKYVFVAYTRSQFPGSESEEEAIRTIGLKAARDAGVPAYWLDFECIDQVDKESGVFCISDIVRGAHALVVAIGNPPRKIPSRKTPTGEISGWETPAEEIPPPGLSDKERADFLLRRWGKRVWTFPEVLLCQNRELKVYERGQAEAIMALPKNRLAEKCWDDSDSSRQLLDHFAGNLILTPLQLTIIAFECLFTREKRDYLKGDHSYVLMGLLLKRPKVDKDDSEFQAFARLSLANDSDRLLERLICLLPEDHFQKWHCVSDGYGVNLWDIQPHCQIAGICDDDTVLIDGAFGATIHWDRFRKVNARRSASATRTMTQVLLHGAPFFFIVGIILFKTSRDVRGLLSGSLVLSAVGEVDQKAEDKMRALGDWADFFFAIGILLLATAATTFVTSPYLTRLLYRGKFWGSQAWLFGFEGYADIKTIESQIFGARLNRLRWSPYGSSLSKSYRDKYGECKGIDPMTDPVVREKIKRAERNENFGELRIFTLVDTNTMTVTLFEAVRPPTVLLLCAAEGGMQRAIACSYQWMTGTCHRETVLRMETPVLEKMSRVSRVKLGVIRKTRESSEE